MERIKCKQFYSTWRRLARHPEWLGYPNLLTAEEACRVIAKELRLTHVNIRVPYVWRQRHKDFPAIRVSTSAIFFIDGALQKWIAAHPDIVEEYLRWRAQGRSSEECRDMQKAAAAARPQARNGADGKLLLAIEALSKRLLSLERDLGVEKP